MYLYGASGHGKVIAEIAEDKDIIIEGFIDKDQSKRKLLDYPVVNDIPNKSIEVIISIGNNEVRKKIVSEYKNFRYLTLVHSRAIISRRASIGEGSVIMGGAIANSDVKIGKHCIINTNASVDHDCTLEDFVHISPNASLAGGVYIGEGSHIGIGASVIQGIQIGKWCTVGAGAVIIRDIPDGTVVVGNPGRLIKN
ncbi:acetyltransferase [Chryseobacterium indoltheticum]|uniref:2,3,4,5-tetrahydropyridine-2,6-dicarboxylate N-acetyltransferase n=1 Tax=Chryseobacterium indoltheticum TaxID=254 RepID=A0A381FPE5_9FLAO|nr:acetyltransferase [Chryseobacterium indoltheticum]SUX48415.1 2,3,4,5-tetrahydropyridine-2,6-dicarboxylate N-acetyltransferase [Chryseobacterium indoltheticum]